MRTYAFCEALAGVEIWSCRFGAVQRQQSPNSWPSSPSTHIQWPACAMRPTYDHRLVRRHIFSIRNIRWINKMSLFLKLIKISLMSHDYETEVHATVDIRQAGSIQGVHHHVLPELSVWDYSCASQQAGDTYINQVQVLARTKEKIIRWYFIVAWTFAVDSSSHGWPGRSLPPPRERRPEVRA